MIRVLAVSSVVVVLAASPVWADHFETQVAPGEPRREFPIGFEAPEDAQHTSTLHSWSDPRVGGWGAGPPGPVTRRPVIFVHGTTETAWFWRVNDCCNGLAVNVRQRFLDAGYAENELWAISYTGAQGYWTYNDVNVEDVYRFIAEVRRFTGADEVDVVAHSLGVTVVRKAAFVHPELYAWIANLVAIAGANHGSTPCRNGASGGLGSIHASHACEELEPGSDWLAELNSIGETRAGPRYLVLYDSVADNWYLGPDAHSPRLDGACNVDLPGAFHLPLARGEPAVGTYLSFLQGTDCASL